MLNEMHLWKQRQIYQQKELAKNVRGRNLGVTVLH